MKASGKNPADIFMIVLASAAVSLGLVGLGGFDLVSEPFGPMMVLSRTASSMAALGFLYRWAVQNRLARAAVRVRR
jgi:uncharacterized membrane protein YuzA (DUF378 family)